MIEIEDQELVCPLCGTMLQNEAGKLWCREHKAEFSEAEVRANEEWRRLSTNRKIDEFQALGEGKASSRYYLRPEQIAEVQRLARDARNARFSSEQTVTPEKQAFLSLARGLSDAGALCELVDNAMDAGILKKRDRAVNVSIRFEPVVRSIVVKDDAGGMDTQDMRRCFTLGSKKLDQTRGLMGAYGIGAKEAFYHFGKEVVIRSRLTSESSGLLTIVPEEWLDDPDWKITIQNIDDVEPGTTEITISRASKTAYDYAELKGQLWSTYERRIRAGLLNLELNGDRVWDDFQYVPLYPPELYPHDYVMKCGRIEIAARIMFIEKPADLSGILLYAQGRRFAHIMWRDSRARQLVKNLKKHSLSNHIRLEVDFHGPIEDIPIGANKDDFQINGVMATVIPILTKISAPYFESISPLSQEGAMSRLSACFDQTPERREPIDLGRITEHTNIPLEQRGDAKRFRDFLHPTESKQPSIETENVPIVGQRPAGSNIKNVDRTFCYEGSVIASDVSTSSRSEIDAWLRSGADIGVDVRGKWLETIDRDFAES